MDRERQTLELLQLLGDEVAEAVLGRLQPERAEKLRAGLKADSPHISTMSRQREVLDEFECFFQFALRSRPLESATSSDSESIVNLPSAVAVANTTSVDNASINSETPPGQPYGNSRSNSGASSGSNNINSVESNQTNAPATPVFHTTSGGTEADADLTNAEPSQSYNASAASNAESEETMAATQNPASVQTTGDPLRDLESLSIHQIAQALASEQSRTTAILLSQLPARLTGDILNLLKPEYQKLVMKELTKEQHAPAVLVERIARATFIRAQQLPSEPPDTRDHADRVAEVLRSVPKAGRRNMLAAIEEQDPELAKSLLTRIYRFDDIIGLNKTVVQRVLGEVDSTNLTTALFGAKEDIKEAIFANLSKRARSTIEEEMQFMTNVAESRIKQARDAIAEIIAKIDMESES